MRKEVVNIARKIWGVIKDPESRVGKVMIGLGLGLPIFVVICFTWRFSFHLAINYQEHLVTTLVFRLNTVLIAIILFFSLERRHIILNNTY